jgi:hypothetical protein
LTGKSSTDAAARPAVLIACCCPTGRKDCRVADAKTPGSSDPGDFVHETREAVQAALEKPSTATATRAVSGASAFSVSLNVASVSFVVSANALATWVL